MADEDFFNLNGRRADEDVILIPTVTREVLNTSLQAIPTPLANVFRARGELHNI